MEEGLVDVGAALVADGEAAVSSEPGVGALDRPAMATPLLTGLDIPSSDAGGDPTSAEIMSAAGEVVALVGMEFGRTPPWAPGPTAWTEDRRDAVDQRLEELQVMDSHRFSAMVTLSRSSRRTCPRSVLRCAP